MVKIIFSQKLIPGQNNFLLKTISHYKLIIKSIDKIDERCQSYAILGNLIKFQDGHNVPDTSLQNNQSGKIFENMPSLLSILSPCFLQYSFQIISLFCKISKNIFLTES